MSTTKEDRSFKQLINREVTDSTNKFYFNELGADTINIHNNDLWADSIAYNDPAQAVLDGVAQQESLFVMTLDPTVPSEQCWKAVSPAGDISNTRVKDWISPKYGANYVVHLFDNNNNEIFTTDTVNWFFDYQTGILTFTGSALSKTRPFKITGYRYIGTKGAAATVHIDTKEALTFNVDYENPSSVDPPTGTIFDSQAAIDGFLALEGASAFKHLQSVIDSLPAIRRHSITINLASGIHRPRGDNTSNAFFVPRILTTSNYNYLLIKGPAPDQWPALPSLDTLVPTAISNALADPYIDFSGTPFSGMDLRGRFIYTNQGQVNLIHKHTDSRLYLLMTTSPTPTSVKVCENTGAILRNSLTDAINSKIAFTTLGSQCDGFLVRNVTIQPWGQSISAAFNLELGNLSGSVEGSVYCILHVLLDFEAYSSITGDYYSTFSCCTLAPRSRIDVRFLSVRNSPSRDSLDRSRALFYLNAQGCGSAPVQYMYIYASYFLGGKEGWWIYGLPNVQVFFRAIVVDGMGCTGSLSVNMSSFIDIACMGEWVTFNGSTYRNNFVVRDAQRKVGFTTAAMRLNAGYNAINYGVGPIMFENCGTDLLIVKSDVSVYGTAKLYDGGGNTAIGLRLEGPNANIILSSDSTIAGAAGAIKLPDGTIITLAELVLNGPYIDIAKNTYIDK